MKFAYVLLLALAMPLLMFAQPKWEGGVFLGISNYAGDLNKSTLPRMGESNVAFGVMGRHHFDYRWAVRANLFYGKISGDDANFDDDAERAGRGLAMTSSLVEFSLMGEWEPLGERRYLSGEGFQKLFSPYFFAGIGLAFNNPELDTSNFIDDDTFAERLNQDLNASYSNTNFTIPFGIGVKYDVTQQFLVSFELGARPTFTDYLDGVSEIGKSDTNDWYIFTGFLGSYRFVK